MASTSHETLLSVLPEDLSAGLFQQGRAVDLAANETLFLAGDPADGCYRVDDGLLKASVVSPSGTERILAILGPGAIVGELAMIDGAPRSASVTAIRPSRLVFVRRANFEAYGEKQPEIYRHITRLLARRLRDMDDALAATSFLSLKGRVARSLLTLADAFGKDVGGGRILVHQKVTQSDLAAMTGIARENVSRILQEWMRQSLISRLGGYYCVEKPATLKREASM